MNSILGTPIYVTPDRPAYVLPEDLPLPDDFRKEFNEWAARFFKPRNLLGDGQMLRDMQGRLHMNPRTFDDLKASMKKNFGFNQ